MGGGASTGAELSYEEKVEAKIRELLRMPVV